MHWMFDPQVWLSFFTLTGLEIILGIDNIVMLSLLVGRLAPAQRRAARLAGLAVAMLTRLALLFSIVWIISLRRPIVRLLGSGYSGRDLVLLLGGGFLIVSSILELHEMTAGEVRRAQFRPARSVGLTVLQIGLLDIVFSLDSVFTAVGLARRVEVMAAAIIAAVLFMMWVSGAVGNFIERHPGLKVVALAFLVVIGAALIADAIHRPLPQGTLYFALAFASTVELINIQVRRSGARPPADDG